MPERLVVMLAYDWVNLIDIGGPLQAFETANRMAPTYRLVVASEDGASIETAPGLSIATVPLAGLEQQEIDTIIVPGGLRDLDVGPVMGSVKWLAAHAGRARRLCSVCTGAFLLAEAGLLEGKRVATHWSRFAQMTARYPQVELERESFYVTDGNVWTSGGVTAGIDMTLALIEADLGHEVALATARQMVMFIRRPGGQGQFAAPIGGHRGRDFASLHQWMEGNLAGDLRVERLAEKAGMSPRNFARQYHEVTGNTPAKAVEALRIEAACRALETSEMPAKAIASAVGLVNEQNLRRVFQRQFGIAPLDYRARFGRRTLSLETTGSGR